MLTAEERMELEVLKKHGASIRGLRGRRGGRATRCGTTCAGAKRRRCASPLPSGLRSSAGLIDGKAPGRAPKLNDAQRQELARIIESGPIPAIHGVVRWRLIDLAQWVWEEYRIRVAKQTLSRQLRAMGFRKLSARPRHRAHKRTPPRRLKKLPRPAGADREPAGRGRQIEVWFQDEARIGQKNKITRRWARRGTRPRAPSDQRTSSTYLFGAICPKEGKGAGLVLPFCNSTTMALHLAEISQAVAQGAHAVLLMDQLLPRRRWHQSR